jgi:hypothetical protein
MLSVFELRAGPVESTGVAECEPHGNLACSGASTRSPKARSGKHQSCDVITTVVNADAGSLRYLVSLCISMSSSRLFYELVYSAPTALVTHCI